MSLEGLENLFSGIRNQPTPDILQQQLAEAVYSDAALSEADVDRLLAYDWLEEEFQKLERAVRQRDCPHEHTYELQAIGGPRERLCGDCGRHLSC